MTEKYTPSPSEGQKAKPESGRSLRVGEYRKILFSTESGNNYAVTKDPEGNGYIVTNIERRGTVKIPDNQIAGQFITEGEEFFYGEGFHTRRVKLIDQAI